jgi:hypothetical protein
MTKRSRSMRFCAASESLSVGEDVSKLFKIGSAYLARFAFRFSFLPKAKLRPRHSGCDRLESHGNAVHR